MDPGTAGYQRPSAGGVWRFMQSVAAWIADPRRKGMGEEVIPLDHLLAPPREAPARNGGDPRANGTGRAKRTRRAGRSRLGSAMEFSPSVPPPSSVVRSNDPVPVHRDLAAEAAEEPQAA
jgi:hypothetical protein